MAAVNFTDGLFQAQDDNGRPLIGGKLYTYENGTTTPAVTYTDQAGTTPNTNPVVLDARGEAKVYLDPDQLYTFVLKDRNDALVWSLDGVSGVTSSVEFSQFKAIALVATDSSVTIRVPTDAATLQAALNAARKMRPTGNKVVSILIESGYKIPAGNVLSFLGGTATVMFSVGDFSYVELVAEDAVVEVADDFSGAILRSSGGTTPRLRCLIDMRQKGEDGWCHENGAGGYVDADCGIINAGRYGYLARAARGWIEDSIWDGAMGMGVHVTQASIVSGRGLSAKNCGTGVYVSRSSVFHGDDSSLSRTITVAGSGTGFDISRSMASIRQSDATGCGVALQIGSMAVVHADNVDCSEATGTAAIQIEGGYLRWNNGKANDCVNSAVRMNSGRLEARGAEMKNAGIYAIRADFGAYVDISNAVATGAGLNAVEGRNGAIIIANGVDASSAETLGFQVAGGSIIFAIGGTGVVNMAKNRYVPNRGLIYTEETLRADGTATIPSGSTSVTVTHGLSSGSGVSARHIQVTPTNGLGSASKFWAHNVTDTTFTISVNADPGANATFAWRIEI